VPVSPAEVIAVPCVGAGWCTRLVSHGMGAADAAGVMMPTVAVTSTAAIPARFHIFIELSLRRLPLAAASQRARLPAREAFPCPSKRRHDARRHRTSMTQVPRGALDTKIEHPFSWKLRRGHDGISAGF
jgi:hypothetical protein